MGAHFMDWILIAVVGLLIFGPKALQGMARSAGRGMGQAKEMKDKLLSELPMDELMRMSEQFPKVPLNSQQAVQMLLTSATNEKPATVVDHAEIKHEPVEAALPEVQHEVPKEKTVTSEDR